jgi:hypothetical protein
MPDPDKSSASAGYTYGTSVVLGLFIACFIMILFMFKLSPFAYYFILYIGVPIMSFLLSSAIALGGQQLACGSMDPASAFLGSVWTPIAVWGFLIISSFSILRAPIISLFSIGDTDCRKPKSSGSVCLSDIEIKTPMYKGLAIGYYVFWGVMFGQTVSSGFSQVCGGG